MKNLAASGSRGKHLDENSFETFLEAWLVRQEHYLDELLTAERTCTESSEDHLHDLIARVLSHYQQYYEHKSIAAHHDVFRLFSPTYLSSLEQSFLWIAGFKPGLALKLATSVVTDLCEEQKVKMQRLVDETRSEEKNLAHDIARIQESVAAPPIMEAVRRMVEDEAVESLRARLESVVGNADSLRTGTAAKVAEILSPVQNVKFFTAVTQLQVSLRSWGRQMDVEKGSDTDGVW